MIGCKDIQKAVSGLLKKGGYIVLARESVEGGIRPACSVDVFPVSASRISHYVEEDTFGVEIIYYPKTETQENLAETADLLKPMILLTPLEIEDRKIHTYAVDFSKEGLNLVIECSYKLTQQISDINEDEPEADELMGELEMEFEN